MVRASTRSKTSASLAAAKVPPKKKVAAVKEAAAKAAITAKVKSKAVPKPPPRKGTRSSARGKKQDAEEEENKENNVSEEIEEGGDADEVPAEGEQQDENQPEMSEVVEAPATADQNQADEEHRSPEPQEQEEVPAAAPDVSDKTYCICNGADDGSPMITCEVCDNWFHFHCIEIDEDQADDIVKWELISEDGKKAQDTKSQESPEEDAMQGSPSEPETPRPAPSTSSSGSDDDDDYVDDYKKAKQNQRTTSNRRPAQATPSRSPSPSPPVSPRSPTRRRRQPSTRLLESGRSASFLKRKTSISQPSELEPLDDDDDIPAPKRARPTKSRSKGTIEDIPEEKSTPSDDPTRKYCLGKLRDVVTPIFVQHYTAEAAAALLPPKPATPPPVSEHVDDDAPKEEEAAPKQEEFAPKQEEAAPNQGEAEPKAEDEPKPTEETKEDVAMAETTKPPILPSLDEAKRQELEQQASAFVEELEQSIFEGFSEPDKKGRKSAGPKYKERFRMLTFNLEKSDRTELRSRIATGRISPAELSHMTSADLANEQLQAEMESMREAAMRGSILEARRMAPRVKMTHKGEELIEDQSGGNVGGPTFDDINESDERKGDAEMEHGEGGDAGDGDDEMRPPMSPLDEMMIHHAQSPLALMTDELQAATSAVGGFDISEVLGDMGLAGTPVDPSSHSDAMAVVSGAAAGTIPVRPTVTTPQHRNSISGAPKSSTNSLLASALASASHSQFNLNSVWGGGTDQTSDVSAAMMGLGGASDLEPVGVPEQSEDAGMMEDTELEEFFNGGELFEPADATEPMDVEAEVRGDGEGVGGSGTPLDEMQVFEALPAVWTGPVQMPNEQDSAWTSMCQARQVGGRNLGTSDFLWKLLFTQPITRIDGRVPVPASTKYLVDTRLNPTKDLVAVALTPMDEGDQEFAKLNEFLIKKGRHGLVFPWAGVSSDRATGRDCYLIPFKAEDPTPEFIELLDNVQLPKKRTRDMMLGVFVLHKDRIAKAQASALSTTPPIQNPPLESMPPPPAPAAPTAAPPLPNLDALASLLPHGGLPEQTKNLLQELMARGGLAAVASTLAQAQGTLPPPPPPVVPPPSAYGATYPPPPIGQYAGATPPYPPTAGGLPPPSTFVGYAPPPPVPPPGVIPPYPAAGPSGAPAYGQASRQRDVDTEGHRPPNIDGIAGLVRVIIMGGDCHRRIGGTRVIGLRREMVVGGGMGLRSIEVVVEEEEVEGIGIVIGTGTTVVGEEGGGGNRLACVDTGSGDTL
ncbi:hypothetical protein FRC04_008170 [Tulasnella sp. 424]|nr:hypothetical protein FRC04_008170 [Tulasnella sp. 424]KAG8974454.1 hypothetical protein FRC05_007253 [Tulasnella sp. 425]